MKLIVITQPHLYKGEATQINALCSAGLSILHLRKPEASEEAIRTLLNQIEAHYWPRIVLHDQFQLAASYPVRGLHLNRRHPDAPNGYQGQISRSCHSVAKVKQWKDESDYLFLSPIFDSISKAGYVSGFSHEELVQAAAAGIIDQRVIALGGIDQSRIATLKAIGFGGVALLGDVWNQPSEQFIPHFHALQRAVSL